MAKKRTTTLALAVVAACLMTWSRSTEGAQKCLTCNSCKTVEISSQSTLCQVHQDLCFKGDLLTGQVERKCASLQECQAAELNRDAYTSITCCPEDDCNGAAKANAMTMAWILGPVALGVAKEIIFT